MMLISATVGYCEIGFHPLTGCNAYLAIFAPPSDESRSRRGRNDRVYTVAVSGPTASSSPSCEACQPMSGVGGDQSLSVAEPSPAGAILRPTKVEEIAEVVAKLPPDQLARFRRWFTAFEAGRPDHAEELDSTATKLGRLAGRAFAELKKRAKEQ
jgi:hypothetical protein